MAQVNTVRAYFYFLFIVLSAMKSLQLTSAGQEGESCSCYEQCHKNYTANSVNYKKTKEACERGCRFFSLVHGSHTSLGDFGNAKHRCMTSCSESYINPMESTACNFGCISVKATDSCDPMEHQLPQITYALVIEESDVLIHPGDTDPDDVLIDPGLRKQIEKTLETFLDPKPKLPEIHFRDLPIMNKEISVEHPRASFKCPKFYGLDSKLEFRNGRITTSDLLFLFSLTVFAMICFIVSRNLERQGKLWKQLLTNLLYNKPNLMNIKDNLRIDEPILQDGYPEKMESKEITRETVNTCENTDPKFEGVALVFYDNDEE